MVKETFASQGTRVSVIRKELLVLTGNHFAALILNQLLYWTERVKDFDFFLEEERSTPSEDSEDSEPKQHGWVYKTANELIEETLVQVDRTTMRRYLHLLIEKGWVSERQNPANKWDKTTQYRVNLREIEQKLHAAGYGFQRIFEKPDLSPPSPKLSKKQLSLLKEKIARSKEQNPLSKEHDARSNVQNAPSYTYTEITTETTNRDLSQEVCESSQNPKINEGLEALKIWNHTLTKAVYPTKGRKAHLASILTKHFEGDLSKWQSFCDRIKSSPFLMGEGPRKWRASLDWILMEANLLKVLEGNFDSPQALEQEKEDASKIERENQIQDILETIEDPVWRYWCGQLVEETRERSFHHLTISDLELLAKAKFIEVEAQKLLWIGSSSQRTLDKIEDLRLPLLSVVGRMFQKVRNIRTRLIPKSSPHSQTKGDSNAE